jgi:tetratricopeptide (TPR) repeat protein
VEDQESTDIYNKWIAAFRRGDVKSAINLLTKLVDARENDHRAWNVLGVAFAKSGLYEDADVCFQNAVMLDPQNQVYSKNRDKNLNYLPKDSKKRIEEFIDQVKEYKNDKYAIGGIIGIILALIIIILIPPILFPAPMADTANEIPIIFNLSDNYLTITYSGSVIPQLSTFQVTADNQTIISHKRSLILENKPESSLSIPFEDLRPYASDNKTTIRTDAIFRDNSIRPLLTKTITIPPEIHQDTPVPTPTPVPYTPKHLGGELLYQNDSDTYLLIINRTLEEKYNVIPFLRRTDGLFQVLYQMPENITMVNIDNSTSDTGFTINGNTFDTDTVHQAIKRLNTPTNSAAPLYNPGDLITQTPEAIKDTIVILGYDNGTDEYATDQLYQYYTGEWGYRKNKIIKWRPRSEVESIYPYRTNHITLYSIGIGSDSSQPGSPVLYNTGDIIAKDQSAYGEQLIILSFNETTDKYETDIVKQSYDSEWYRTGNSSFKIRSLVEREYPYKVRTIDTNLLKSE